jgi:hypothetical protein
MAALTHSVVLVSVVTSHLRTYGSNQAEKSITSDSLLILRKVSPIAKTRRNQPNDSLGAESVVHLLEVDRPAVELEQIEVVRGSFGLRRRGEESLP